FLRNSSALPLRESTGDRLRNGTHFDLRATKRRLRSTRPPEATSLSSTVGNGGRWKPFPISSLPSSARSTKKSSQPFATSRHDRPEPSGNKKGQHKPAFFQFIRVRLQAASALCSVLSCASNCSALVQIGRASCRERW